MAGPEDMTPKELEALKTETVLPKLREAGGYFGDFATLKPDEIITLIAPQPKAVVDAREKERKDAKYTGKPPEEVEAEVMKAVPGVSTGVLLAVKTDKAGKVLGIMPVYPGTDGPTRIVAITDTKGGKERVSFAWHKDGKEEMLYDAKGFSAYSSAAFANAGYVLGGETAHGKPTLALRGVSNIPGHEFHWSDRDLRLAVDDQGVRLPLTAGAGAGIGVGDFHSKVQIGDPRMKKTYQFNEKKDENYEAVVANNPTITPYEFRIHQEQPGAANARSMALGFSVEAPVIVTGADVQGASGKSTAAPRTLAVVVDNKFVVRSPGDSSATAPTLRVIMGDPADPAKTATFALAVPGNDTTPLQDKVRDNNEVLLGGIRNGGDGTEPRYSSGFLAVSSSKLVFKNKTALTVNEKGVVTGTNNNIFQGQPGTRQNGYTTDAGPGGEGQGKDVAAYAVEAKKFDDKKKANKPENPLPTTPFPTNGANPTPPALKLRADAGAGKDAAVAYADVEGWTSPSGLPPIPKIEEKSGLAMPKGTKLG